MRLMVLDGNSLAYRAFFALPADMATSDGTVTNAVFGFTSMLANVVRDHSPDHLAVVFDRKEPTFRHELAPEYKAQRESQPDILYQQLDTIRELLGALGVATFEAPGFEGDDIIATIVRRVSGPGNEVVIVTGDRDSYQLVADPWVRVVYNKRGVSDYDLLDEAGVEAKTGVPPSQYADYAALRGDPSDNLHGVPGVGEKTAARLIVQYGSIGAVFDAADEQSPKLRENLLAHRERVVRNAALMRLRDDVPIDLRPEQLVPAPDQSAVARIFARLEFASLLPRIRKSFEAFGGGAVVDADEQAVAAATASVGSDSSELSDRGAVASLVSAVGSGAVVVPVFDGGSILGVAIAKAPEARDVWWIPGSVAQEAVDVLAGIARPTLHDAKPWQRWLLARGAVPAATGFDTAVAAYLLDASSEGYDLPTVALRYAGLSIAATGGRADGTLDLEPVDHRASAAAAARAIAAVAPRQHGALAQQGVEDLYRDVELPLVSVLARMEHVGIGVDRPRLETIAARLDAAVGSLADELHRVAGRPVNLNSPTQLRQLLYEDRGLAPGKKTKTGYSTDAATLERLAPEWPEFILPLLRYRELEKLRSTYGTGLLDSVAADGRIHATFNQMVARTGRLSSDAPNLHNIPVRTEEGRAFREAFVPAGGCGFVVADYNQIELRCIAHLARDPGLIDAFTKGEDVHVATAARVFGVAPGQVTAEMRSTAKMVSYGLAYGMEAYGLGQRLGVPVDEAASILESYFGAFPRVRTYMDEAVAEARNRGFTQTLFGRRRIIPELNSPNHRLRQIGERQAMNAAIQGLAADIFKIALVRLQRRLDDERCTARIVLQVHDEVILEVPVDERSTVEAMVREVMGSAADLAVPLEVHLAWGASWAAAKG